MDNEKSHKWYDGNGSLVAVALLHAGEMSKRNLWVIRFWIFFDCGKGNIDWMLMWGLA